MKWKVLFYYHSIRNLIHGSLPYSIIRVLQKKKIYSSGTIVFEDPTHREITEKIEFWKDVFTQKSISIVIAPLFEGEFFEDCIYAVVE